MTNRDIKTISKISKDAESVLNEAAKTMELSARSYMRIIKVERTIADLDESADIGTEHIAEALQYRSQSVRTL